MMQSCPHFREAQLWLITQTEEGFGATPLLPRSCNLQDLIRGHGVSARFAGISTEGAIATVVAAQVRQRDEDLARVGNDIGFESLFEFQCRGKESWEFIVRTTEQRASDD